MRLEYVSGSEQCSLRKKPSPQGEANDPSVRLTPDSSLYAREPMCERTPLKAHCLLELWQHADAVRAVRRELIYIVTRVVVALDEQRSVIRHTHIPADYTDLRHDLTGLLAERYDLVPQRDPEALYCNAGERMHIV